MVREEVQKVLKAQEVQKILKEQHDQHLKLLKEKHEAAHAKTPDRGPKPERKK
jgi:hypothetical protein